MLRCNAIRILFLDSQLEGYLETIARYNTILTIGGALLPPGGWSLSLTTLVSALVQKSDFSNGGENGWIRWWLGFVHLFIQLINIEFQLYYQALCQVLLGNDIWDPRSENCLIIKKSRAMLRAALGIRLRRTVGGSKDWGSDRWWWRQDFPNMFLPPGAQAYLIAYY